MATSELSVTAEGQSRVIARIGSGEAFGEMGLMTGEPRTATATALTEVVCYRLDKAGFKDILQRRPEIANPRPPPGRTEASLEALRLGLHAQALQHTAAGTQPELLPP